MLKRIFFWSGIGILFAAALASPRVLAGYFEVGFGGSYSKSTYSGSSESTSRRYGGSFGYNFSDQSTVELAYQNNVEKNHYEGYEDSKYEDKVYSVNWVQNFFGRKTQFQPYIKLGIGQLNRDATVTNSLNQTQHQTVDSLTIVMGAGLRYYLTQEFAIRLEATTYLQQAHIDTWRDNLALTVGGSVYF